MINYKIYILVDRNNPSDIRYVGKTKNKLENRLRQHILGDKNSYKNNWIKKIGKDNLIISSLKDTLTPEEANFFERQLIKECREIGYRLTNLTDGGEGWFGMEFSETHRKNISLNHADVNGKNNPMFGKRHTRETINKISEIKKKWFKEKGFTEEQIENMRIKAKGEKNPNASLKEEDVLNIRNLFNNGLSQKEIAKKYKVNSNLIFKIVRRYTWKHLP